MKRIKISFLTTTTHFGRLTALLNNMNEPQIKGGSFRIPSARAARYRLDMSSGIENQMADHFPLFSLSGRHLIAMFFGR